MEDIFDLYPDQMIEAIRAAGHTVKMTTAGEVDWWSLDLDDTEEDIGHAGPSCAVCLKSWCSSCWTRGHGPFADIEPCTAGEPR